MPLTTYTAGEVLTASSLNANFAAAGGLALVKTQTIGTSVTSVAVTSAFSSTYDNYLITISGGVSAVNVGLELQLGATTTGYYNAGQTLTYAGVSSIASNSNGTKFTVAGVGTTDSIFSYVFLGAPNLAKRTIYMANTIFGNPAGGGDTTKSQGYLNDTTQYTGFTYLSAQALTGGTIRVYGYQNS